MAASWLVGRYRVRSLPWEDTSVAGAGVFQRLGCWRTQGLLAAHDHEFVDHRLTFSRPGQLGVALVGFVDRLPPEVGQPRPDIPGGNTDEHVVAYSWWRHPFFRAGDAEGGFPSRNAAGVAINHDD